MTDDRPRLTQLAEHRWPTVDWPIARLTVRLPEIAARNGLVLETWEEDGLGSTTGRAVRLPSGVVILLLERAHSISHFDVKGPDLYADATDAQRLSIEPLLAEALVALGLEQSHVEWRNRPPTEAEVAAFKESAAKFRMTRDG